MKSEKHCIFILLSVLAVMMFACGDAIDTPVTTKDTTEDTTIRLAPANADQKVYITPSTMKYHLAGCLDLTSDKTVVLKSEAIAQGYTACERCFPTPKQPLPPMVYVMDGNPHYHLANCSQLNDTKQVILKSEAIQQGYTPCFYCTGEPIAPSDPHVYMNPGENVYHRAGCPCLVEAKVLVPMTVAIEQGYTPCKTCYWQTGRIIRNPIVWVTEVGQPEDPVYHAYDDCQSLYGSKILTTKNQAEAEGRRLCEHCRERMEKDGSLPEWYYLLFGVEKPQ